MNIQCIQLRVHLKSELLSLDCYICCTISDVVMKLAGCVV